MKRISLLLLALLVAFAMVACDLGGDDGDDDGGNSGGPVTVTETFTGLTPEASMGWNASDATATVVDDPVTTGDDVLQVEIGNYNAAPVVALTIPAGATLADYASFTFELYAQQGDVGYKTWKVFVSDTAPTGAFDNGDTELGSFQRDAGASSAWETITMDISGNASALTGTVYFAFGASMAGTGDVGGSGVASIWFADDVSIIPAP